MMSNSSKMLCFYYLSPLAILLAFTVACWNESTASHLIKQSDNSLLFTVVLLVLTWVASVTLLLAGGEHWLHYYKNRRSKMMFGIVALNLLAVFIAGLLSVVASGYFSAAVVKSFESEVVDDDKYRESLTSLTNAKYIYLSSVCLVGVSMVLTWWVIM